VRVLRSLGGRERIIHKLPLGGGWTEGRDMPAPAGRTFRELYAARQRPRA
jgi:L-lactate dehydrogenase complex protein LldF